MRFRKFTTKTGSEVLAGKDAENNDELVRKFKGKENVIMHTAMPGSPFCVIDELNPSKSTISTSGALCASYSQDWRDNKQDVRVHVFTGKDVVKVGRMKVGTWKIKKKPKIMLVKKIDILKFEKNRSK